MRILYIECNMGVAGDMLSAALLELLDNPEDVITKLNSIAPEGVSVSAEKASKCGITGTQMHVVINGEEEGHGHNLSRDETGSQQYHHDHEHHHHHASMEHIAGIINAMDIPDAVKTGSLNVYKLIADAESKAHGMPVSEIHFHEVGTLDAVMDVTSVCYMIHELAPDVIYASPVRTGFGEVKCAHGVMPVPAPATSHLLEGIPTYAGDIEGEMCTPTGAALLKYFTKKFCERPLMAIRKTGYGMGHKDFPSANCVRTFIGESTESVGTSDLTDQVVELKCNLDDMTGEQIGYAMTKLFDAGALDVFTTSIGMKKNRPGILLTVLCRPEDREAIVPQIFKHTTTIGIREALCSRYILQRTETTDEDGIRAKTSTGYGVTRKKSEFDDLARLADKNNDSVL
ncbi:MAG: nickel pincer cofactor biosynthesis protein LarC [Lachnospiraceae bacterium]|nr:nickel pincer cofactor biosynthesis protein LarC [Lachnospiraceae bacterium]